MSQSEEPTGEKEFCVEIAKQGRAACKKCKQKCLKDEIRIAKLVHNPFGDGKMKSWHHVECIFEVFLKQRPTTKRIESTDDIDGFDQLPSDSQDIILKRIEKSNIDIREKYGAKVDTPSKKAKPVVSKKIIAAADETSLTVEKSKPYPFKDFRRLVAEITNVNGYLEKTEIVSNLFKKGTDGNGFQGDIHLWCKLLLPGVIKRIYNLQSKQLVKIFSRLFKTDQAKMLEHLEQGDIGETIQQFYEMSPVVRPVKKSNLTVEQVDEFLEELSKLTKEEEQMSHFLSILKSCTSNDLKIIIRLIKHDLRMNAGAKHILEGVHPDAYTAYQSSRDLGVVLKKCLSGEGKPNSTKGVSAAIKVMTPVLPMLAEACKSVEMAMSKCPNGMYSEIKYDGERVQVHKKGSEFKYFSRSLKPVLQHKIAHFKDHIPQAFISGNDLILDSEILMIDTETQAPLPFGSLGKHKRDEYENACVCLYVFDCLYYNGEDLTKKPIEYRKKILRQNMTEVKNHIVFSESKIVHKPSELREMMIKVFKLGLEGLVLKDLKSIYEPGKRHWLKVKKDYLFDGAMADTADLIVLGAWYGTGKKGGKMSVFLMGCYDERRKKFYTVTKVHTGLDDKTLDDLQTKLDMIKISSNPSKVPDWLVCNRPMVPDFVAKDPKNQPVWEITGAEFTQHDVHTANGISIRFPRITKRRDDKDWKTATSLEELKTLYEKSKEHTDVTLLLKDNTDVDEKKNTDKTADTNSNAIPNDSPKEFNKKRKLEDSPEIKKTPKNKQVDHINTIAKNGFNNTKNSEMIATNNISSEEPNKKRKIEEHPPFEKIHKTKKENHKSTSPLYFKGVRLYLEEEVKPLFKSWNENFSSYGGIILNSNEIHKATHVLHMNRFVKDVERRYPAEARHVLLGWIDDTIKENQLQDYQLYSVKWRPDL